jgi:preprotein translocase subunit SecD
MTMRLLSRNALLVAAALVLLAGGGLALWFFVLRPGPPDVPDINEVGGTVLVYEIDRRKEPPPDLDAVAGVLQRRFQAAGLPHVTARPLGGGQVEVGVPRAGDHAEELARVKALLARVGTLEFCVLANSHDDAEAIRTVMNQMNGPSKAMQAELGNRQRKGLPPPPPLENPGDPLSPPRECVLRGLPGGATSRVTYRWIELGTHELTTLGLDSAAKDDPVRGAAWREAAEARGKAVHLSDSSVPGVDRKMLGGAVFFSRPCLDENLDDAARRRTGVEYFVLARDPELDETTGKPTPPIDGSYIIAAHAILDDERPAVAFQLNPAGGGLLRTLTRRNVPGGPPGPGGAVPFVKRHLAIILDGQVVMAPTINSEISTHAQISGQFTRAEVEQIASVLAAGALPVALSPTPVRETVVEPKQGAR